MNMFYMDSFDFKSAFGTLVHELIHILGFSSELFDYYCFDNGTRRGSENVYK